MKEVNAPRFGLYRRNQNDFRGKEVEDIERYKDQHAAIKSIDFAMTPFMDNHNDHMQRMAQAVARQEVIQRTYLENSKNMPNQAKYEQMKDENFDKMFTKVNARNDFSQQNKMHTDDQDRRRQANEHQRAVLHQIREHEAEKKLRNQVRQDEERRFV